jgi:hypothetical protein
MNVIDRFFEKAQKAESGLTYAFTGAAGAVAGVLPLATAAITIAVDSQSFTPVGVAATLTTFSLSGALMGALGFNFYSFYAKLFPSNDKTVSHTHAEGASAVGNHCGMYFLAGIASLGGSYLYATSSVEKMRETPTEVSSAAPTPSADFNI